MVLCSLHTLFLNRSSLCVQNDSITLICRFKNRVSRNCSNFFSHKNWFTTKSTKIARSKIGSKNFNKKSGLKKKLIGNSEQNSRLAKQRARTKLTHNSKKKMRTGPSTIHHNALNGLARWTTPQQLHSVQSVWHDYMKASFSAKIHSTHLYTHSIRSRIRSTTLFFLLQATEYNSYSIIPASIQPHARRFSMCACVSEIRVQPMWSGRLKRANDSHKIIIAMKCGRKKPLHGKRNTTFFS